MSIGLSIPFMTHLDFTEGFQMILFALKFMYMYEFGTQHCQTRFLWV
jgi:hypothetical protein